jgi:2-oxo-4-hydroxy-4-carboxy--5-ureidoimidazoline (OHCU) decarboxylase
MSRTFYAIVYAYGRNVINHGTRPDYVHRFSTIAERQRFLAEHANDEQDVDPIDASDPLVRKALRYAAQIGDNWWPMAV